MHGSLITRLSAVVTMIPSLQWLLCCLFDSDQLVWSSRYFKLISLYSVSFGCVCYFLVQSISLWYIGQFRVPSVSFLFHYFTLCSIVLLCQLCYLCVFCVIFPLIFDTGDNCVFPLKKNQFPFFTKTSAKPACNRLQNHHITISWNNLHRSECPFFCREQLLKCSYPNKRP